MLWTCLVLVHSESKYYLIFRWWQATTSISYFLYEQVFEYVVERINDFFRKIKLDVSIDLCFSSLQVTTKVNGSSISEICQAITLESLHFFGCNGFYGLENILVEQGLLFSAESPRPLSKQILEQYLGEEGLLNTIEHSDLPNLDVQFSFQFH